MKNIITKKSIYEQCDIVDGKLRADQFYYNGIVIEMDDGSKVDFNYTTYPVFIKYNGKEYMIIFTEHNMWHRYFIKSVARYRYKMDMKKICKKFGKWIYPNVNKEEIVE